MIEPAEVDRAVGMECYASDFLPCPGSIKMMPEDFQVEEVPADLGVASDPGDSSIPLYRVEKRGIDTLHMERRLGEALKSRVTTAGMKDKRSVAVQFATPTSRRGDAPELVDGEGFVARRVGFVRRPIGRGSIFGNRFRILVRGATGELVGKAKETFGLAQRSRIPNFYGLQRFGGRGNHTHLVGREIVKGRYSEAVERLLYEPRKGDSPSEAAARSDFKSQVEAGRVRGLPAGMDLERMAASALSRKAGDYVAALRAVPIKVRRLYVQAYQSYLFNKTLSRALMHGLDISKPEDGDNWGETGTGGLALAKVHGVREPQASGAVPLIQLPGYATRDYQSRFDRLLFEVMGEEDVSPREFYIKELQETSAEGGFRRPAMTVVEPSVSDSEMGVLLEFTLGRGNYATVLIREMVKPVDPVAAGFA